jgi:hypothetical protein
MKRTSRTPRSVAGVLLLLVILAAACSAPVRPSPAPSDADGARELARDAGEILLQLSAYDYGLAGSLSGQRVYAVDPVRYAAVARATAARIQRFSGNALAATLEASGPVKERVITLADGLVDLARGASAYADGGDPAQLASVTGAVARSWDDLRALTQYLRPKDEDLARTISRGSSFVVTAKPQHVWGITVGPFATSAEADSAAKRIGTVEQVARSAPFVIRVGTYPDKKSSDTASAQLTAKGFTGLVVEEDRFTFSRSGPLPDVELWREPERVFDTWGAARRVAVATNAAFIATGSDDGTVAVFSGEGALRSLPRFNAGVAYLAFSDDARWLFGGGQTLANFLLPQGTPVGGQVKLPSPAQQVVYVPKAYYFASVSKGATGEPSGGPGVVAGRAPDGAPLLSFPITIPSSGGALATTRAGELYIATNSGKGETDVEVLDLTRDRTMRGVLKVPGEYRALAIDPGGVLGAVMTDKGVFRFGPHDSDPAKTLVRIADPVMDLAFGLDGTLYLLSKNKLAAHDLRGELLWSTPLIDGRRLIIAKRPVVLDAADHLLVFSGRGSMDDLGISGSVQDVAASPDGQRVAVLSDGRRAVLFKIP